MRDNELSFVRMTNCNSHINCYGGTRVLYKSDVKVRNVDARVQRWTEMSNLILAFRCRVNYLLEITWM